MGAEFAVASLVCDGDEKESEAINAFREQARFSASKSTIAHFFREP